MNIDEAIEILANSAHAGVTTFDQNFKDAEKLGIEALKYVKMHRAAVPNCYVRLLPGESVSKAE